jgi:hypothetical protein
MSSLRAVWQAARLTLAAIIFSTPAFAGTLTCAGTVEKVAYHSDVGPGRLMLKLSSMNTPVFICSPDAEWVVSGTPYKTPPATCKAMYATFLAARMSGAVINYVHFDGDAVPPSCDAWGNWQYANVRYFAY